MPWHTTLRKLIYDIVFKYSIFQYQEDQNRATSDTIITGPSFPTVCVYTVHNMYVRYLKTLLRNINIFFRKLINKDIIKLNTLLNFTRLLQIEIQEAPAELAL